MSNICTSTGAFTGGLMPQFNRINQRGSAPLGFVGAIAAVAVGAILLFASLSIIESGEGGVVKHFGKVTGSVLEPGTHFINPFDTVVKKNVQLRNYTMSAVNAEGQKVGDDSVPVLAQDQIQVRVDASVLYNLDMNKLPFIEANIKGDFDEQVMRPQIREAVRFAAAEFQSEPLTTTARGKFADDIHKRLSKAVAAYGVNLQQVLVRDVKLPDQVVKAINDKKAAAQDSEKQTYILATVRQQAEQKRVAAQGEADAARILAEKLTPMLLEARRIDAMKELAIHANYVMIPADSNMLMQAPQVSEKKSKK